MSLVRALNANNHRVEDASDGADVIPEVGDADMVILSQRSPGDLGAIRTGTALRASGYDRPIVILVAVARPAALRARRFPIDVWPVAEDDRETLLHLVNGCTNRSQRVISQPAATTVLA